MFVYLLMSAVADDTQSCHSSISDFVGPCYQTIIVCWLVSVARRRVVATIVRTLRQWTNHFLFTFLFSSPFPTCEHLTVEHILCTCTKYECNRKQYFH